MEDELDLKSIQALVDNYVEDNSTAGWKYLYMCFVEAYLNKDKSYYLDELSESITENDLYAIADFWAYRSLVSDFILDYEITYLGNNSGNIKLYFK